MNRRTQKLVKAADIELTREGVDCYEGQVKYDKKGKPAFGEVQPINHKRRMRRLAQRRQISVLAGIEIYKAEMLAKKDSRGK